MTNTQKINLLNSRKHMSKISLKIILALMLMFSLVNVSFGQGAPSQNNNVMVSSSVSSSTPTAATKGVNPTIGSYGGSNFDKINLFNGNVSMSFPLASLTSRGGMSVGIVLSYNSKIWRVERYDEERSSKIFAEPPTVAKTFHPVYDEYDPGNPQLGAGWTIHAGRLTARQSVPDKQVSTSCFFPDPTGHRPVAKPAKTLTTIVFTAPDGTEYDLRDTIYDGEYRGLVNCEGVSRGNTFVSKDGTSATFVCDTNIQDALGNDTITNLNGYLYLRDGTRFRIQDGRPVQQRDHNGNIVKYEYTGNQLTKVTDNMGRTITVVYGNFNHTLATITIKGFGGADRVTTVRGDKLAQHLVSGQANLTIDQLFPVEAVQTENYQFSFNPKVVSEVILPDGHQWSFQYNSYGEVIRVITPAGGKVEYDMGPSTQAGGGAGGYNENKNEIFRRILSRSTYPDPTKTNTQTNSQAGIEGMITYTDPTDITRQDVDGNVTVTEKELDPKNGNSVVTESRHKFSGNPLKAISGRGYREWREGKELETRILNPATGSPMRTVVNQYQLRAGVSWAKDLNGNPVDNNYLFQPENDPRVIQITSSLQDGAVPKTSVVDYAYDGFNNVTSEQLTGYNGEIIRKVERTYVTNLNGFDYTGLNRNLAPTGDPNFYDIHMRSLIASETIKNSAQIIESQTTYEYDIYSSTAPHADLMARTLTVDSQATNYQSASRILRGNVTSITRGFGTVDATTTYPQYDVLGNVVAVAGPLANQLTTTNYSTDSQFTFPTSTSQYVNDSLTGNRILTSSRIYDFYTGLVTSSTGLNGADETTTFEYNDMLDRLTREVRPQASKISLYPTGFGSTAYTYSAPGIYPNTVMVDTILDNSSPDRKLHSESKFDGFLRTMEQHRTDPDGEVVSQTFYDATGRVSKVTNPFRNSDPTDPTASTKGYTITTYDGLDRVKTVETFDNFGSSTGKVTSNYDTNLVTVTDQANKTRKSETDAAGRLINVYEPDTDNILSILTSYAYDARSNLKQVTQGIQRRFFTYDSLSRLTSASSPETGDDTGNGLTSYIYDKASNLRQRKDPRSVITNYTYDSLNRLATKTYNDSTPAVNYFYDAAPNSPGISLPPNFTYQYTLGRTTAIISPATTSQAASGLFHTYDIGGRIAQSSQLLDGKYFLTNSKYNEASLATAHTYPSGRTISHSYNIAGQLTSVARNGFALSSEMEYSASGALSLQNLPNGLHHSIKYNSRLQPASISLGTSLLSPSTVSDKMKLEYSYGVLNNDGSIDSTRNNGNIASINLISGTDSQPIRQDFKYDELNRLKQATEYSSNEACSFPTVVASKSDNVNETPDYFEIKSPTNAQAGFKEFSASITFQVDLGTSPAQPPQHLFHVAQRFSMLTSPETSFAQCDFSTICYAANNNLDFHISDFTSVTYTNDPTSFSGFDLGDLTSSGVSNKFRPTLQFDSATGIVTITYTFHFTYNNSDSLPDVIARIPKQLRFICTDKVPAKAAFGSSVFDPVTGLFTIPFKITDPNDPVTGLIKIVGNIGVIPVHATGEGTITGQAGPMDGSTAESFFLFVTNSSGVDSLSYYDPAFSSPQKVTRTYNLEQAQTPSWQQTYDYDRYGNRLAVSGTNGESLSISQSKNRITSTGYQYDLAGNLIKDTSKVYVYDAENRLIKVTTNDSAHAIIAQYFYDGNGWRIKKVTNSTTTRFVYDQSGTLLDEYEGVTVTDISEPSKEYYYSASGLLATSKDANNSSLEFLTPDHLGSARVISNFDGNVIGRRDFFPWGQDIDSSLGGRFSIPGYTFTDSLRQKFTGYEKDDETGLDFAQARYFGSASGRFMSVDPLGRSAHIDSPQTWNRYAYTLNNPINFTDPLGLDSDKDKNKNNGKQESSDKNLDNLQSALFVVGFIPGVGDVVDLANAAISYARGDKEDALVNAIGAIPIAGSFMAGGLKIVGKVDADALKAAEKTSSLETRAAELTGVLKENERGYRTTAVGVAEKTDGSTVILVASDKNRVPKSQRNAFKEGEIEAVGNGHAEETIVNYAKEHNMTVKEIGVSRPTCLMCESIMYKNNVPVAGETTNKFSRLTSTKISEALDKIFLRK